MAIDQEILVSDFTFCRSTDADDVPQLILQITAIIQIINGRGITEKSKPSTFSQLPALIISNIDFLLKDSVTVSVSTLALEFPAITLPCDEFFFSFFFKNLCHDHTQVLLVLYCISHSFRKKEKEKKSMLYNFRVKILSSMGPASFDYTNDSLFKLGSVTIVT